MGDTTMYTQADLDALTSAIETGTMTLTLAGESVTFQTITEMLVMRDSVINKLQQLSGYTFADLANLDAAIKSGEKVVRLNNRSIEYQSIRQMLELRELMKAELSVKDDLNNNLRPTRPRSYRARSCRGY